MTTHSNKSPATNPPGNDGSWFLEAIGAKIAESPKAATVAASSPSAARSEGPTTIAERYSSELSTPTTEDPLVDFAPQELDKRLDSTRSWQWPFVILSAVIGIAIVFGLLWLPRANQQRATEQAAEYEAALAEVLNDLAATQQALATLTDPDADVASFGALVAPVTDFQADADAAVRLGSAPIPSPMPLASSTPYEALIPLRDALATYGTSSDAIARRLSELLEYRSIFDSFLDTGPLPAASAGADVDAITTALANASVDSATILSLLPNDAALAEHKLAAESVLVDFADDQLGYLDALRTGDDTTAGVFLEALAEDRSMLDRLMAEALGRLREDIDLELVGLSTTIAEVLAEQAR